VRQCHFLKDPMVNCFEIVRKSEDSDAFYIMVEIYPFSGNCYVYPNKLLDWSGWGIESLESQPSTIVEHL
jgi:hypothetical protein